MTTHATHAAAAAGDALLGDATASKAGRSGAGRDASSFEREVGRASHRTKAERRSPAREDEREGSGNAAQAHRSQSEHESADAERTKADGAEVEQRDPERADAQNAGAARRREKPIDLAEHARELLDPASLAAALTTQAGDFAEQRATDLLRQVQLALLPADAAATPALANASAPSTAEPTNALESVAHARAARAVGDAVEANAFELVEPEPLHLPVAEHALPSAHDAAPSNVASDARGAQVEPAKPTPTTVHEPVAPPMPLARVEELAEQRAGDILRQVRLSLQPAERHATIQLDPPELGRIAIRLVVRRGRVDAELRVEERGTLDVLARHVPELRATLERSGLHSGSFDLQMGFGEQRGETAQQQGSRAPREFEVQAQNALRSTLATKLDRDAAVDTYA